MFGGYGSWNIIGWIVLAILGLITSAVFWHIIEVSLRHRLNALRFRFDRFTCSLGWHRCAPIRDGVTERWKDLPTNSFVTQVTHFKRCPRCRVVIKGTKVTTDNRAEIRARRSRILYPHHLGY